MIYDYVVTLKNTRARHLDRISLWLLFISVALFLRIQFVYTDRTKYLPLGCAILIIGIVVYAYFLHRRYPGRMIYYSHALFIAAIGWVPVQGWFLAPLVIMALLERQAKRPLEIGFSDDTIVINTLFRRKYHWADFSNIILKDDLLTLDFKSNRLIQRETIDEEGDAEEDEFNDYCRERLARANALTG